MIGTLVVEGLTRSSLKLYSEMPAFFQRFSSNLILLSINLRRTLNTNDKHCLRKTRFVTTAQKYAFKKLFSPILQNIQENTCHSFSMQLC